MYLIEAHHVYTKSKLLDAETGTTSDQLYQVAVRFIEATYWL